MESQSVSEHFVMVMLIRDMQSNHPVGPQTGARLLSNSVLVIGSNNFCVIDLVIHRLSTTEYCSLSLTPSVLHTK